MKFVVLALKPVANGGHVVDPGEPFKGPSRRQALPMAVLPFEQAISGNPLSLDMKDLLENGGGVRGKRAVDGFGFARQAST